MCLWFVLFVASVVEVGVGVGVWELGRWAELGAACVSCVFVAGVRAWVMGMVGDGFDAVE